MEPTHAKRSTPTNGHRLGASVPLAGTASCGRAGRQRRHPRARGRRAACAPLRTKSGLSFWRRWWSLASVFFGPASAARGSFRALAVPSSTRNPSLRSRRAARARCRPPSPPKSCLSLDVSSSATLLSVRQRRRAPTHCHCRLSPPPPQRAVSLPSLPSPHPPDQARRHRLPSQRRAAAGQAERQRTGFLAAVTTPLFCTLRSLFKLLVICNDPDSPL